MTPPRALAWLTYGRSQPLPAGRAEPCRRIPTAARAGADRRLPVRDVLPLTVHDIVRFARSVGILCQGRGSAANSAVCYFCLGIPRWPHAGFAPAVSSASSAKERQEPPDIDVDFEHDRREEVIQYICGKYGRDRAAIAAVVTTYRTRSVLRDVGKALGVHPAVVDAFAKEHHWFDEDLASHKLQAWPNHWASPSPAGGTPPACGWNWR